MKRNFGLVSLNGLHVLHEILTFEYYGSHIMVVVQRECSKPAENTSNFINNEPPTEITNPCTIHTNRRKHYGVWESFPIDLDKWPFWSLTFLASSLHRPASLYKEKFICNEEMLKYSFRTEVQPGSHRLADLWPFASKSNTRLLFTVLVSNME